MSDNATPDSDPGVGPSPTSQDGDGGQPHPTPQPTVSVNADVTVDALASQLVDEAPDAQPHAIEQQRQLEQAAEAQNAANVNDFPGFDPTKHATNPDGTPAKTPTGRYKKLSKTGGAAPKVNVPADSAKTGQTPTRANKEAAARAGGAGAANLFITACVVLGGQDFVPRKDAKQGLDEHAFLTQLWGDYFVASGKTDLSPGWALFAGSLAFIIPRLQMQHTQTRFQKVKTWIYCRVIEMRAKRAGVKVKVSSASEAALVADELKQRASYRAAANQGDGDATA